MTGRAASGVFLLMADTWRAPSLQGPYQPSGVRILDLTGGTERDISLSGLLLIMGMEWAPDSRSLWLGGYMGRSGGGTRSGLVRVDLTGHVRTVLEGSSMASMVCYSLSGRAPGCRPGTH